MRRNRVFHEHPLGPRETSGGPRGVRRHLPGSGRSGRSLGDSPIVAGSSTRPSWAQEAEARRTARQSDAGWLSRPSCTRGLRPWGAPDVRHTKADRHPRTGWHLPAGGRRRGDALLRGPHEGRAGSQHQEDREDARRGQGAAVRTRGGRTSRRVRRWRTESRGFHDVHPGVGEALRGAIEQRAS